MKQKGNEPNIRPTNGIQFKLSMAFMLPVCCIIILGIVSYTKASSGIIHNYEDSISQTLDMTGQYYDYSMNSIMSDINVYYQDPQIIDYYGGLMSISPTRETQFFTATEKDIKQKAWTDDSIEAIYILSDDKDSVVTTLSKDAQEKLYTTFLATSQGITVSADTSHYYFFGVQTDMDEQFNISSDKYAIRLARKFDKSNTVIIADINREKVSEVLDRLDMGKDSLLGLVTADGVEILSTKKENAEDIEAQDTNVFKDKSYYLEAVKGLKSAGFQYVEFKNETFMFIYSKIGSTGAMICSLVPKANIMSQASDIKNITIIIVIFALILSTVICSKIAGGIGKTIRYFTLQLKKAALGDLTVEITTKRKDEFSILAKDIADMISNTKFLIQKVKDVGADLFLSANQVTESSKTFVLTAKDIKIAISEIEAGVTQLDENSANCIAQMDSLSSKIKLVNENTTNISAITDITVLSIEKGIHTMNDLTDKTKSTTKITENVIKTIELLQVKSKSIGEIVNVINGIAQQTNLLSLNASIESARAGAAGRGFAVVADEIRKLADQSVQSANQISSIIGEIISSTDEAVKTAKEAEIIVQLQEVAVTNTTSSFNAMDSQIENLMAQLSFILNNVQNMEEARSTTSGAIESISAVSEETTACSLTVSTTAEKQLNAVTQLDTASTHLLNQATDLETAINQFKID